MVWRKSHSTAVSRHYVDADVHTRPSVCRCPVAAEPVRLSDCQSSEPAAPWHVPAPLCPAALNSTNNNTRYQRTSSTNTAFTVDTPTYIHTYIKGTYILQIILKSESLCHSAIFTRFTCHLVSSLRNLLMNARMFITTKEITYTACSRLDVESSKLQI